LCAFTTEDWKNSAIPAKEEWEKFKSHQRRETAMKNGARRLTGPGIRTDIRDWGRHIVEMPLAELRGNGGFIPAVELNAPVREKFQQTPPIRTAACLDRIQAVNKGMELLAVRQLANDRAYCP
jgi:hypothetical protein